MLGWGIALGAVALAALLGLIAHRWDAGARFVLGQVGGPAMAVEPLRDEAQVWPWADPTPLVAELPGGYPVIAATRPSALWWALRRAHVELGSMEASARATAGTDGGGP